MCFSTRQIISLLSLPGIGHAAVLKAATAAQKFRNNLDFTALDSSYSLTGAYVSNNSNLRSELSSSQLIPSTEWPTLKQNQVKHVEEHEQYILSDYALAECLRLGKITKRGKASGYYQASEIARALSYADAILAASAEQGIFACSYFEPDFPLSLKQAVDDRGRKAPALVVFGKGNRALLHSDMAAVIGSRDCFERSHQLAMLAAETFVNNELGVVSGLALGCDAAAHIGALRSGTGKTVAVLAHGLDMVFPPENTELAQCILDEGGLLLSEYALGEVPKAFSFIARDRLQAALSAVTLVIQTKINGGTMHAAKATHFLGHPLYVLNFKDAALSASENTQGNHNLVENYGAQYIEDDLEFQANIAQIAKSVRANMLSKPCLF